MFADADQTLIQLCKFNIKLKPSKCAFGVMEGKFLGVIVTKEVLQANPEKIESQNKKADVLSKSAFSFEDPVKEISVDELQKLTIEMETINTLQGGRLT
ncbi:hypothetical protein E3N88_23575 [Mikania micrantha]|uniref:Reverse transcriptase domain-containing protein n=1 Tax=Mikania micrantha TaxID=192012 RepID=A0A5N6NDW4_9ASTR|nr:hypothetical protein E3N88_23575 [Mikania micrantha]